MLNSKELEQLRYNIKETGKLASLIFRDFSSEQIDLAIRQHNKLDGVREEKRKITIQTVEIFKECMSLLPEAKQLLWRLCVLGMEHPEHANVIINFKPDVKASLIFKVEDGDNFWIAGCAVYSKCDNIDRYNVSYGFAVGLDEAAKQGRVGEINLLEIAQGVNKNVLRHILLHCCFKLICPTGQSLVLTQDVDKIIVMANKSNIKYVNSVLLGMGFHSLECNSQYVYILEDIEHLQLPIPRDLRRFCPHSDAAGTDDLYGDCE
jgi:hypothetical protein